MFRVKIITMLDVPTEREARGLQDVIEGAVECIAVTHGYESSTRTTIQPLRRPIPAMNAPGGCA